MAPVLYEIRATPLLVEFWSSVRLTFEPRGEMQSARAALKAAIAQLVAPPNTRLSAMYISAHRGFCDVENVLLYNVGTGVFRQIAVDGLEVQRLYAEPVVSPSGRQFAHYQRYTFSPIDVLPAITPTLAFPLNKISTGTKPHAVWWAVSAEKAFTSAPISGCFRLDIALPVQDRNLAALAKPLLDGIICALHPASTIDELAVARLTAKTGWSASTVRQRLLAPPCPLLAPRKVLARYRDFVKWDPADELCDEFLITPVAVGELCQVWVRNSAQSPSALPVILE